LQTEGAGEKNMRRLFLVSALGALLVASPPPVLAGTGLDLASFAARTALDLARSVVELRYDDIVVDERLATVSVLGLEVRSPVGPIRIDTLTLDAADPLTGTLQRVTLRAAGVHLPTAALPLPPSTLELATGRTGGEVVADLALASRYDNRDGGRDLDIVVSLPGSARLDLTARIDGIHYDLGQGRIAGRVERAALRLDDEGLVGRLLPALADQRQEPVPATRAWLGQTAQGMLPGLLGGPETSPAAEAAARALSTEVGSALTAFLADPHSLTIVARPPHALTFAELEDLTRSRDVTALGLHVTAAPPRPASLPALPAGPPSAQNAGAFADLARHYALGIGVPQDFARAAALAGQAADQGSADGSLLAAQLLAKGRGMPADPVRAYRMASLAAAAGEPGAMGLMVDLESRLPAASVAAAQKETLQAWRADGGEKALAGRLERARRGDPDAMRNLAQAFLIGNGAPRNYQQAYLWADLAAAAGDSFAAALRDKALAAADAGLLPPNDLAAAQQQAAALWAQMTVEPDRAGH
jgi:TPR repeat protein